MTDAELIEDLRSEIRNLNGQLYNAQTRIVELKEDLGDVPMWRAEMELELQLARTSVMHWRNHWRELHREHLELSKAHFALRQEVRGLKVLAKVQTDDS